jgi:deoxyribodipyrimidine photo-lyase
VTKKDNTPFKVFTPFWRVAEQIYVNAVPSKLSKVLKKKKSYEYFKNNKLPKEILPKKNWFKKFENYWDVSENKSQNLLSNLIKNKINNYGTNRDIPSVEGTSKLSPYIKHGQIHVEKIYKECSLVKPKNINIQKYINELGWREFSHSSDKLFS